jgi:Cytochrome P460
MQAGAQRTVCAVMRRKRGLFAAILALAILPFAAQSADDLKLPDGYRKWFHVNALVVDKTSPVFDVLGGVHNVYVNATGEEALKKGEPYPDDTVLIDDVHESIVSDGSYAEGPRKIIGVMVKDKKKYASTGGWGWQAWAGGDPAKPVVKNAAKECFECHQARKDHDYVYSTYIP